MSEPIPGHAKSSGSHWASLSESTFLLGIRLLFWVRRRLGAWPFMLCLYPVVLYYWASQRRARQASQQYLQRLQQATGALGHAPGWRDSMRHFIAFAETIMDKLLAVSGAPIGIDKHGTEGLLALLAQRRGAVIVTGHVGCLELCRVSAEQNQHMHRLNVLVHTRHAERFNRLLRQLHPDAQVELLQVSDFSAATAMLLAQKVVQGEFIAIAGDRVPVGDGMTVTAPFLGQLAPWPAGPYVLAALLKCPLYAMVCVRQPYLARRYRYAIHAHCLAEQVLLPRRERQAVLAGYAQQYAQWLTGVLREAPLAWFNFFDFWQQGPTAPAPSKDTGNDKPS